MGKIGRGENMGEVAQIEQALVRNLEEEMVDPYYTTVERLQHMGIDLT